MRSPKPEDEIRAPYTVGGDPLATLFQKLRLSGGASCPSFFAEASAAERKIPCAMVEIALSARAW